jgi:hypothetical protein
VGFRSLGSCLFGVWGLGLGRGLGIEVRDEKFTGKSLPMRTALGGGSGWLISYLKADGFRRLMWAVTAEPSTSPCLVSSTFTTPGAAKFGQDFSAKDPGICAVACSMSRVWGRIITIFAAREEAVGVARDHGELVRPPPVPGQQARLNVAPASLWQFPDAHLHVQNHEHKPNMAERTAVRGPRSMGRMLTWPSAAQVAYNLSLL